MSACLASNSASARRSAVGLVGADALDEVHQRGLPAAGVGGLVERVDHQPGDQLVAAVGGRVPVRAVVAVLDDQVLLRQPLQHGHDRGVGQVAVRPTAPRGPGARSGARARTTGGPSPRARAPLDASAWPCSVHLLETVDPAYYGLLPCVVSYVCARSARFGAARSSGADDRQVTGPSRSPCESSHRGRLRTVGLTIVRLT